MNKYKVQLEIESTEEYDEGGPVYYVETVDASGPRDAENKAAIIARHRHTAGGDFGTYITYLGTTVVEPDCTVCNDTGNAVRTGWQHVGYDELGCPSCNEPDGNRCCEAVANGQLNCSTCGHPVEPVPQVRTGPDVARLEHRDGVHAKREAGPQSDCPLCHVGVPMLTK